VTAAAVLFAASFFILPYKRKRAIEEFCAKTERLRGELRRALGEESRKEIDRSVEKVRGAVEPYTRFVRGERTRVEERAALFTQARERLAVLKREIEGIVPAP
jgi:hypothetical protein